jgi:hypothetical protein
MVDLYPVDLYSSVTAPTTARKETSQVARKEAAYDKRLSRKTRADQVKEGGD